MKQQTLCATKAHVGCKLGLSHLAEKGTGSDNSAVHLSLRQASVSSDEVTSDHSDLSNGIWSQHTDDCEIQLEDFEEEVDDSFSGYLSNVKVWNDADSCLMTPPKKVCGNLMIPWTPTANLKLLLKAASPDIRMRDLKEASTNVKLKLKTATRKKQRTNSTKSSDSDSKEDKAEALLPVCISSEWPDIGKRKEKSLGILCQRFLEKYPLHLDFASNREVKLNEVAQYLGVSRRRVYDIINVMEAIDYAVRLAKNKYTWHGNTQLVGTIARLQETAKSEGLAEQINSMMDFEDQSLSHRESVMKLGVWAGSTSKSFIEGMKKSLTFLSQKFLMLFLAAPNNTMNLDLSAKVLLGDPTVDQRDMSKFKTTIRRLYDIANILTSLGLIRKVHGSTESKCRKPAFAYIGPKIEGENSTQDVINSTKNARTLSKHLSFDQICVAAEFERTKLCSVNHEAEIVPSFCREEIAVCADHKDEVKSPADDLNSLSVPGKRALFKTHNETTVSQTPVLMPGNRVTMLTMPRRQFNQFFRTKSDGAIGGLSVGSMQCSPKLPFSFSKIVNSGEPVIQVITNRKRKMEQADNMNSSSLSKENVFVDSSSANNSQATSPSSSSDTKSPSPRQVFRALELTTHETRQKVQVNLKDKISSVDTMPGSMPLCVVPLHSSDITNVKPCLLKGGQSFQRPIIVIKRVCRNKSSESLAV